MARVKSDREFWESGAKNNLRFQQYYRRLVELTISMFEWKNLPPTIDPRFLELCLFAQGKAVFFKDEALGFLALTVATGGNFNVYRIPGIRRAYAVNGYQNPDLNEENSVLIYNNYLHTDSMLDARIFAERLSNIDATIEVNVKAQRTPILVRGTEQEMLSLQEAYLKYDGNQPVLFADKEFNPQSFGVLKTDAPYIADKLYTIKTQYWNEFLTYMGISNINVQKKERLITDEVTRNQGGVIASRYSRLEARREACDQINQLWPELNIWVDYREDFQELLDSDTDSTTGDPNDDEKEDKLNG